MVPFVLGHFTVGADARRLNELLASASNNMAAGGRHSMLRMAEHNSLADKLKKPRVLAPVAGILLGLWRAEQKHGGCAAPGIFK